MTTRELQKALRRRANARDVDFQVTKNESIGHHRTFRLGDRTSTVVWSSDHLTAGVLRQVLKNLGVTDIDEN